MLTTIFVSKKRWNGCRLLAKLLGVSYPAVPGYVNAENIISWGVPPTFQVNALKLPKIFNKAEAVAVAVSKLRTLTKLKEAGVPCLEFGTNAQALRAAHPEQILVARTLTASTGGKGIVIIRPNAPITAAPLYTVYARKRAEYRVHVVTNPNGEASYFIQQKRKKEGVEQTEDQKLIRSHANGWTFAVNNLTLTSAERPVIQSLALAAVKAVGLDFGAVDIVQRVNGNFLVCEINTAPGLEGESTLNFYRDAIPKMLGSQSAIAQAPVVVVVPKPPRVVKITSYLVIPSEDDIVEASIGAWISAHINDAHGLSWSIDGPTQSP